MNHTIMPEHVLHLSHTDIRYDSRILKEMEALSVSRERYSLHGLGVAMNEGNALSAQTESLKIECIHLASRGIRHVPVLIRHALSLMELTVKMSMKAVTIRPRIIHAHDTLVLPLAAFLKMVTGARLIYDAHELESDRNGLTRTLSKITASAEKVLWPFIDHLIVVSPSIQAWYRDNIGTKPSEVILNSPIVSNDGERTSRFDENYLRRNYGIAASDKVFIYAGIFGQGRGIESLVDVFSSLEGAHVVFLGYGELADFIAQAAGRSKNIHIHAAVAHEEVVDVIRSADVGLCMIGNVSLSDYYCLPNKLFEYCFAGVPVIASDFPDISAVVEEYHLGVCCGPDKESIRGAVESFMNNKIEHHIDGDRLHDLSWEAQKQKLLRVYEQVSSVS